MRPASAPALRALFLACLWTAAPGSARADPPDPLLPLMHRIAGYFRRGEIDGITRDSRYDVNPAEFIRLSVVSQLLAYEDLYHADPLEPYRNDVVERADFLLENLDRIRSQSAFDGMLGYALLGAYEITGDTRYLVPALQIVDRCKRLSGRSLALNWGLMAAMALAKHHHLTGDVGSRLKTIEIIESLDRYQHADGSFPHYCEQSTDVHYTGWMGMELAHVARFVDHARIGPQLEGIHRFLRKRVGPDGRTSYQEPCPDRPGCWIHYYDIASGCYIGYDTRGWNNELGYNALSFDRFQDPKYHDVMGFLYSLESHGSFADKWDYFVPVWDPGYVWASNDDSVIRTSVIFWSLASMYRDRHAPVPRRHEADGELADAGPRLRLEEPDGAELPSEPLDGGGEAWRRFQWSTVDRLVLEGADMEVACRPPTGVEADPPVRRRVPGSDDSRSLEEAVSSDGLASVTPNPALRAATVSFRLAREASVSLAIHDAGGRLVRELVRGELGSGTHRAVWDGHDREGRPSPSGLYWIKFWDGSRSSLRRLVLLR